MRLCVAIVAEIKRFSDASVGFGGCDPSDYSRQAPMPTQSLGNEKSRLGWLLSSQLQPTSANAADMAHNPKLRVVEKASYAPARSLARIMMNYQKSKSIITFIGWLLQCCKQLLEVMGSFFCTSHKPLHPTNLHFMFDTAGG